MDAAQTAELEPAVEPEDLYELPPEDERTAWYAPGLLRRVGRRHKVERAPRRTLRQRMQERGLHFGPELVVGVFVAVLVVSLATIAVLDLRAGTGGGLAIPGNDAQPAAGTGPQAKPTPTPLCIAAPIPGSAMRPCAH